MTAGALGLAGVVAAAIVVRPPPAAEPSLAPHAPPLPVTVPVSGVAGADGVFARGTADGHAWQLAVQDIVSGQQAILAGAGTDLSFLLDGQPRFDVRAGG